MKMNFKPETEDFLVATKEYIEIWNANSNKIIDEFKRVTGLEFIQSEIDVLVYEGPSWSGKRDKPMKLRSSYSKEVKRGTLIHELGHRLIVQLKERPQELDGHQILFLFLYDVWTNLYGLDFATMMVSIESERAGIYDYDKTWKWALKLSASERQKTLNDVKALNELV